MFAMIRRALRFHLAAWACVLWGVGQPRIGVADVLERPAVPTTVLAPPPDAGPLCDDAMDDQATSDEVSMFCQHRRKGLAAYDSEKYREAIQDLTQAYRIYPAPRILYKLGQAHRRLGEFREARQFLSMFLAVDPSIPAEQRQKIAALLSDLARRIEIPPPLRPRWRIAAGSGLAAAGGLLLGFGVPALAVDGGCVQPADLPGALCPQRFDTSAVGTALVVPAVTLIVLGTTLAAWPATRRATMDQPQRSQQPLGARE